MSYCRFTDDSDVYAYECEGGVQFWVAGRTNKALDRLCNMFNEAYQYAKDLRDKHGLKVPGYAIEELRIEALEEAKRISGPGSVVAELQAENDKLREEIEVTGLVAYVQGRKQLRAENAKLRELCGELLRMAESHDPEWLHWPEMHEELRKLGVEVDG